MTTSARDSYLETQVHTATPQRLRLLLIEGALREARAGQAALAQSRQGDAVLALARCRDMVVELLSGIRDDDTSLVRQTLGIYAYLFSALAEVQQTRDLHQLAGIIRVLEEEQLTWQEVCLALPERIASQDQGEPVEEVAPQRVAPSLQDSYGPASSAPPAPISTVSIEA
jgi:flagellar protein FliS